MREEVRIPQGSEAMTGKEKKAREGREWGETGLKVIFFFLLPLLIFGLVWLLMSHYSVTFFWKLLSSTAVAVASVSLFKEVFKIEGRSKIITGVILALAFLIGVTNYAVPKEKQTAKVSKSGIVNQVGVLKNVNDTWVVNNIFHENDEIDIEVSGGHVKIVGGRELAPGKYQEKTNNYGMVVFKALSNEQTKIRVWFKGQ